MKKLKMKIVRHNDVQIGVQQSDWLNKFKVSAITATMTSLICTSVVSHAADSEIYIAGQQNNSTGTVVMMLDTSGSMDSSNSNVGSDACDLPSNLTSDIVVIGELTSEGYTRNYCHVGARYYYRSNKSQTSWWSCGKSGRSENDANINNCSTSSKRPTDLSNYDRITSRSSQNDYYLKRSEGSRYYDRISRLKEALYKLAMAPVYNEITNPAGIKKDVKIGIGTFPYYEVDRWGNMVENNKRGYMRIPADKWGEVGSEQRTKVLNLIKRTDFKGTGGTPTSAAYAEAAAYLLGTTTGGGSYSGINISKLTDESLVSGSNYVTPLNKSSDVAECSGQGIYFLTDGQPQSPEYTPNNVLMGKALGLDDYNNSSSLSGGANNSGSYRSFWGQIGAFAKSLNNPSVIKKALGVQDDKRKVLTAVVGFGSVFDGSYNDMNQDAKNAHDWGQLEEDGGEYGLGGFIAAKDSEEIVKSLNAFIDKVGGSIPSISTGSSTIPMDALNPEIIQPFAYFPQFEPKVKPEDTQQLWFGNLKKYYVVNNGVYASESGDASTVVLKSTLQDLRDIWGAASTSYPSDTPIYEKYGALSKLKLGTETITDGEDSITTAGRKVFTDYVFDGTKSANQQISRNFDLNRIDYTYTTDAKTKNDEAPRVRGLMSLLGYNIPTATATNGLNLSTMTASLRQMGSIYHSLPVLLTQEGKAEATRDATGKIHIGTTGREDYVMFGTTQGLLSVVDAETGIEKFSFVPTEMIEKQAETFRSNAGNLTGGKNSLYYGLDGEWAAHTVYVTKPNGTLTVKEAVRNAIGSSEDKENFKGKQWVYGGMRMGGRSYYALDLTDIENPALKFHIDPSTGKVYSKAHPEGKAFSAIGNMGQSWSKPKLDYVNWKGQRKLVMFVGGGYDAGGDHGDGLWSNGIRTGYAGYEQYNYEQENQRGSGVYMFDADSGDLLWYANTTVDSEESTSTPEDGGSSTVEAIPHISHNDLKYSVVSEIKTVDRNNDGMVDHIYFGDLAGQAFRVDFSRNTDKFNSQITKILDLHQADGTSPRFYYSPVFTAHHSSDQLEGANVVVVSFISGNKSSPLLATSDSPVTTGKRDSSGLQYDGVYAVYDYDIHPNGQFYPDSNISARTLAATTDMTAATTKLMYIGYENLVRKDQANGNNRTRVTGAVANSTTGWGGWYFRFDKKFSATGRDHLDADESVIKGLTPLIAMEGNLYVTMYDASEDGTSSNCGAGVKGQSFTQRICLPTGVCAEDANYSYNLGAGIVSLNVGSVSGGNTKSIVVPDPDDIGKGCVGENCKDGIKFIEAGGSMRFIPNRWYERYAKK
ncbi:hypothetical protein EC846_2474 [Acinetobacter sp. BIGb0102]|uniref:hypothetical protein n=1 Tax=Acinetobacter sp. BIGb0102 TaxID=2485131 RepID=UPI000FC06F89|nr:hypothetical protein [Acinetobacter sp. BIGb0102]RPE29892.1 hypothetical protein EC846_2474 [Acinetobacter sp. BIGb0102]